jgi:hypothetical protein
MKPIGVKKQRQSKGEKEEENKGRAIKNQTEKWGKCNKKTETQKVTKGE